MLPTPAPQARPLVLDAYQHVLGRHDAAYESADDALPVAVLEYRHVPYWRAVTLITAGLSALSSPPCGTELLIACTKKSYHPDLPSVLGAAASKVFAFASATHGRIHGGEVLGPHGPILPGSALSAFFVCSPVFHPPTLGSIYTPAGPVAVWWLVPIHATEADWVQRRTPAEFLRALESHSVDAFNLSRDPLAL